MKIELTGNPFVDTGLAVIGSLGNLSDINNLTTAHLKSVYGNGSNLTEWNSKFKSFTQIFGTNNPLYQTGYGFKKGKGPSDINKKIYKSTLNGLLSEVGKSKEGSKCWACGISCEFDFGSISKKAIRSAGRQPSEAKWVGRDWFPLSGSLGSDAQSLPGASQPPHICSKCLFAVHYLPLGVVLLDGRLTVFQCTSTKFWFELVKDIVEEAKSRIHSGSRETIGSKEGSRAVIIRLLSLFERLQKKKHYGMVSEGTALYVWRFSNSGSSPDCQMSEIPNTALWFLGNAIKEGLRSEIEGLVGFEGKNPKFSLYQCMLERRDYHNLYPEGRRSGASPRLFTLYQTRICEHSSRALQIAHKLAKRMSEQVSKEELRRLQRLEAFREGKVINQFRKLMVLMADNGELTLEDYLDLFPLNEGQGITVKGAGWDFIRFYLHHADNHADKEISREGEKNHGQGIRGQKLLYYAGHIYNRYLDERGTVRFKKEVLEQFERRIRVPWLMNQFIQLAESEEGFTYGHWSKLCKLDNGKLFVLELLFQMRLLWSQWVYENRASVKVTLVGGEESADGLPDRVKGIIDAIYAKYVEGKGLGRFYRDILLRLRRREIGLLWLKKKLIVQISEYIQPLTEQEWEMFLIDEEGNFLHGERMFQICLALANLYRAERLKERRKEAQR